MLKRIMSMLLSVYFSICDETHVILKVWNNDEYVSVLQEARVAIHLQCAPGRLPSLSPQNRPAHHEGKRHI